MSILFGLIIGLALGLTGGGGSTFGVPLLIFGAGVSAQNAVVISLAAVAVTAAVGATESGWRGLVEWRAGLIFAVAGMLAAPVGVYFNGLVSAGVIVVGFAALMLAVSLRMGIKSRRSPEHASVVRAQFAEDGADDPGTVCQYSPDGRLRLNAPCSAVLVLVGLLVGVLSGFFGVGGGFLIVPALMAITRMGIHRAVATSLFVIALIGLSGVSSALLSGRPLDWVLTALFIAGGVTGMLCGRFVARYLAGPKLQMLFAVSMFGIAVFMLWQAFVGL